ncbi:MAG TPA: isoaspartyl peptidase/L-asparaginase [Candidatus Marinimicrobia bacterium]|nr:isoaspartyl peptidase/L-asparaginase [Candidatus Neomarinimicrobiota bacterium]HIB61502.1 isoaspartyl peptidase/L-asparaginase [Candidatus Neomarinimicrobiota bacterium]
MKRLISISIIFFLFSCAEKAEQPYGLVIHGGAGTITRENMSTEKEAEYISKLTAALKTGYAILEIGGSSIDAVEATIKVMEDSPLFNAGKGAVFTGAGTNELDASIMDGATLQAGAVAGVKTVKNPISAARKVMEETWHVLLAGEGADAFAKEQGLDIVDNSYFHTEHRFKSLIKAKEKEMEKHGTVGCVALDKKGNLAAGTSTGGLTNKRWGRVGDSPIIGAGTYASNETCAVSGTGQGEYFIRGSVAYDIAAQMDYEKKSVQTAAQAVIDKLTERGGTGGVIVMDSKGNIAMSFNTEGMYRGFYLNNGELNVKIYKD